MNKQILTIVFAFMLCAFNSLQAQTSNIFNSKLYEKNNMSQFADEWQKGRLITLEGKVYGNIKLRYDAFTGQVQYLEDGKAYVPTANVGQFHIFDENNQATVYKKGFPPIDNNTLETYYIVLYNGDNNKLLKRVVKSIPPELDPNYYSKDIKIKVDEYYYIYHSASDEIVDFIKTKKSLKEALGKQGKQVLEWMKEKKLRIRDDADLVAALEHYDTLN